MQHWPMLFSFPCRVVKCSTAAVYLLGRVSALAEATLDTGARFPFLPFAFTVSKRGYDQMYQLLDLLLHEFQQWQRPLGAYGVKYCRLYALQRTVFYRRSIR